MNLLLAGALAVAAPPADVAPSAPPPAARRVYVGARRELDVEPPRVAADIAIDGRLDEEAWAQAALLTGFTRYAPVDGVAAADSTHVLVWYSPTAIHFGLRAFDASGAVRANVAERDRIFADDNIEILLGTFNDGRQATVLAVNPLGAQADGVLVETGRNGVTVSGREGADLSPDFVFESKGRLTEWGFEVEIRVPFKSLRYTSGDRQTWDLNVVRRQQRTGYEDSWAPVSRSQASFLVQSGKLSGLTDLRRGLVVDIIPTVTQRVVGADAAGRWDYDREDPEIGGSVRWGITNNLTMNGTVNPDFSQVESDVGQFAFDPRQALFFPERRPFFLDGIEQFNVPNRLIYTRRVVQPVAAAKLAGKAFGTDIGFLSAVDDRAASATLEDRPLVNILRLQRDVGRQSRVGAVYTDRVDGDRSNRVLGVDGRLVLREIYQLQFQAAASRDAAGDATATAALWEGRFARNGRRFGMRYRIYGVDDDFRAGLGFISRPGIVNANIVHSYTFYGKPGALLENVTPDVTLDGTWKYDAFIGGDASQDRKLHLNLNTRLRGGWRAGASVLIESFGYDPDLYADYALLRPVPGGGTEIVPFTGTPRIPNLDYILSAGTPQFRAFSASAFVLWGRDENFFEWASADILWIESDFVVRPTSTTRVTGTFRMNQVKRRTDGSTVNVNYVPRLTVQFQPTPAFFVRLIGEYAVNQTDSLRDESRTGLPIVIRNPGTGEYERPQAARYERFRGDVLVSYLPTPGTVVYAGYGNTLLAPNSFRDPRLRRAADAFFLKLSYLFRL